MRRFTRLLLRPVADNDKPKIRPMPYGRCNVEHHAQVLLGCQADRQDDSVVRVCTESPSLRIAAEHCRRQHRCRDRGQPGVPGSETSGLSDKIAAGRQSQIRAHCHGSLHLPHRRRAIAQDRVVPGDNKGHAEEPGDGGPSQPAFSPCACTRSAPTNRRHPGQRRDIKTKLFEPLDLGRGFRTEHPYLVAALLQPWGDACYVPPDAPGTGGQ